jgi:hypothetical protein
VSELTESLASENIELPELIVPITFVIPMAISIISTILAVIIHNSYKFARKRKLKAFQELTVKEWTIVRELYLDSLDVGSPVANQILREYALKYKLKPIQKREIEGGFSKFNI